MTEPNPRTYFFKASHPVGGEPILNPVLIIKNKLEGIETTLMLDANLLIRMEKANARRAKLSELKQFGLHNFVSLLQRTPQQSICLSPGTALDELPPKLAEQARIGFEEFIARYLPSFTDAPNSIQKTYIGKQYDYGFFDLEPIAQSFMAIPFASLLYIGLIQRSYPGSPIEKFAEYLRIVSSEIDILSMKEIEIAKYCFANPSATAKETIDIRRRVLDNFLKTKSGRQPVNSKEALAIAFNGACDINLVNAANLMDFRSLDGTRQDCWIATGDRKFFEFSRISHYVNLDGEPGKHAATTILPEHEGDKYWVEAVHRQRELSLTRAGHHASRSIDVHSLIEKARNAIVAVERAYAGA